MEQEQEEQEQEPEPEPEQAGRSTALVSSSSGHRLDILEADRVLDDGAGGAVRHRSARPGLGLELELDVAPSRAEQPPVELGQVPARARNAVDGLEREVEPEAVTLRS
eukprot:655545-Rhodomonas_salina.4